MISKQITDSDMIILNSVESYLKSLGTPVGQRPEEKLVITQHARDILYSDIVQRVPRVASYLLTADMETDTFAQGLFKALSNHALDPVFIDILMQYLGKFNNAEENGVVGAFLVKVMDRHISDKKRTTTTSTKSSKKGDKVEETSVENNDMSEIKHIHSAINHLLGDMANIISTRCGNLTHNEALAIAACIAMNNKDTISEVIASDLPITAQLFDIVSDPSNLIKSTLLIEKEAFTKLTQNQTAFIDSLKRWVYDKLNIIPMQTCYQFLVATYGSVKPDTGKYLIQIKDCGKQYNNLLEVAKQLVNQK